jgi:tetratricopeptide (TPR) repeat protein
LINRRPEPDALSVVFFGNCQMAILSAAFARFAGAAMGARAHYVKSRRALLPVQCALIASADVVVEQVTLMDGVMAPPDVPAAARRVQIPVVDGSFLWPYSGTPHPESAARYPGYHPFRREMGDHWLVSRLAAGVAPERAAAEYRDLDIARSAHLDRRLEMALELQALRDAATPFSFAPSIERDFRAVPLFRTPYHLEAPLLRLMLLTLLAELGAPPAAADFVHSHMTRTLFMAHENALHPGVAAHFGLAWAGPGRRTCFWREALITFDQFVDRFSACQAFPEVGQAVDAVACGRPDAAACVEHALALVPDSPWALQAAATLAAKAGDHEAALALLERVLAELPGMAEARFEMGESLLALGHADAALAAFEQAVAEEPFVARRQMRLASLYQRRGEPERAAHARRIAAALRPDMMTERARAAAS